MKRVLIVEDNQVHIDAAYEQFEGSTEYVISIEETFIGAIQKMNSLKIDIVMTDIEIPYDSTEEKPEDLGLAVALAAIEAGCERVHIVTDLDRHKSAVARALCNVSNASTKGGKIFFQYQRMMKSGKKNWLNLLDREFHDRSTGLVGV